MEIQFPPGVVKTDSLAASVGRYVEADHIRWVGGHAEKIGGWQKLFPEKLEGIPRSMHVYRAPSGLEVFAYGTEIHLYVSDAGDPIGTGHHGPRNITPFRTKDPVPLPANPFTTTAGSFRVRVHHPSHGAITGDSVYFSGATVVPLVQSGEGIVIAGKYKITNIISGGLLDVNNYLITDDEQAPLTGVGGGSAATAHYEVNIGTAGAIEGKGYGLGKYGDDTYGDERDISETEMTPRYWSLDNYGTSLLASYQGGTIWLWNQDDDARPIALGDKEPAYPGQAPTDVIYAFVTEERFIFALREDMKVSWPDQDQPANWTAGLTSKANTRTLAKGNKLIAGGSLGSGVSLVWSDTSLYAFQFTGGQFVYSSRMAGTNCGLVGPGAFCMAEGTAFWAGTNGFHIFNGSVQGIPNADDIHAWFYGNMTPLQRRKTTCWYNAADREVWWTAALGNPANKKDREDQGGYDDEPPGPQGVTEPTHYVYVNIDSWYWGAGELPRTCAAFSVSKGLLLGTTTDGKNGVIYQHEIGVNAGGPNDSPPREPLKTVLRSGLYRVSEAEKNLDIFGFSPDFEWQVGDIEGRVFTQDRPMNTVHADSQRFTLAPDTGMADIRVRGRYVGFELTQKVLNGQWRMGIPVAEMQEAGARR